MPDEDWLVEYMNCGACRTISADRAARATCNRCCGTQVVDRYSSGRLLCAGCTTCAIDLWPDSSPHARGSGLRATATRETGSGGPSVRPTPPNAGVAGLVACPDLQDCPVGAAACPGGVIACPGTSAARGGPRRGRPMPWRTGRDANRGCAAAQQQQRKRERADHRQSRSRHQVRDDRELHRRRARVSVRVPRGPGRDVHRHGARGRGRDRRHVARVVLLQLRRAAVPDDQVFEFEVGHRLREDDRDGDGAGDRGAPASLLMATVGDVVSASTQLNCAPPPASNASSASRSLGSTRQLVFKLDADNALGKARAVGAGVHSPASRSLFSVRFTRGSVGHCSRSYSAASRG